MSPRRARSLRQLLSLPRRPSDMDTADRAYYRSVKRLYNRLPSPTARALFVAKVLVERRRVAAALSVPSQPSPSST